MIYVVEAGDTLYGIAQGYTGNGNRYSELLPLNSQITDPNQIEIGEMINLPDSWVSEEESQGEIAPQTGGEMAAESSDINATIIKVALIGVALAGAYWWYGKQKSAKPNPRGFKDDEFFFDPKDEEEDEECEDETEDNED